jgi:hypothetical protein
MNRTAFSALALTVAALVAGPALAQDAPVGKTREQVKAELAEALRTGHMPADGESGQLLNQVYPHLYPKAAPTVAQPGNATPKAAPVGTPVSKTRAQVKAELAEAIRTGNVLADSESGRLMNEVYPNRYPQAPQAAQAQTSGAAGFGG